MKFTMYCEGAPTKVTVDDALPVRKNNSLAYARSAREGEISLPSYFEKSFVKRACRGSYDRCSNIHPNFAFSSISECMTGFRHWEKEGSKDGVVDCIKCLVDTKSSVVIGIIPALKPDKKTGHGYVVMDYSKAI